MSEDDSDTIYSDSPCSSDGSDTEGSLADFIADSDEEEEKPTCTCRAEICQSNIVSGKRKRKTRVVITYDEDVLSDSGDSSYAPSESGESEGE